MAGFVEASSVKDFGVALGAIRAWRNYCIVVLGLAGSLLLGLLVVVYSLPAMTFIADGSAPGWFRNFGGRQVPEIHDQDVFFHNIGGALQAARTADIVAVGPSFVSYALDRDRIAQFRSEKHSFYNMAYIGIRGGEFTRLIAQRWSLEPKLWLINADDQFIHFFSRETDLTLGPKTEKIRTVAFTRLRGFVSAASRTIRWRLEDLRARLRDGGWSGSGLYRNIETGDMDLDVNPRYRAKDNVKLKVDRDPNCRAKSETVSIAREFRSSLKGELVLMLVPHSQHCQLQAKELADALSIEVILPSVDGYSTVDGGGHLDQRSAQIFTDFVLTELVKTKAYQRAFGAGASSAAPK